MLLHRLGRKKEKKKKMAKAAYVKQIKWYTASLFRLTSSVRKKEKQPPNIQTPKSENQRLLNVWSISRHLVSPPEWALHHLLHVALLPSFLPVLLRQLGFVPSSHPRNPAWQCRRKIKCVSLPCKPDNYRAFLEVFPPQRRKDRCYQEMAAHGVSDAADTFKTCTVLRCTVISMSVT